MAGSPSAAGKIAAMMKARGKSSGRAGPAAGVVAAKSASAGPIGNRTGRVGPVVGRAAGQAANNAVNSPSRPTGSQLASQQAARDRPDTGTSAYSAGNTVYGGGRPMPTVGPVNRAGYRDRDLKNKAKRNALLNRLRAGQGGKFKSSDYLRGEK